MSSWFNDEDHESSLTEEDDDDQSVHSVHSAQSVDIGLDEYNQDQPWDDDSDEEEAPNQDALNNTSNLSNPNNPAGTDDNSTTGIFYSYADVVENLGTLQAHNTPFESLINALNVVFDHFNDVMADTNVYMNVLEKLGCLCDQDDDHGLLVSIRDDENKELTGKDAIQQSLHRLAQVIGVLHMAFLKCPDPRASNRQNMTFDTEEINVKLAELYYRQTAFNKRVMVDFDIVHPMTTSSSALLNKATSFYQRHAAFYRFLDGMNSRPGRSMGTNTDMSFLIYFTIYELSRRGYRIKDNLVYKQIMVPKRKPIPSGMDADGNPVYGCAHRNSLKVRCNVKRTEHRHPLKHVFKTEFEVSKTETWDTHYWQPLDTSDFSRLESASISNFLYRVCESNGTANEIIMGKKSHVVEEVEKYLVRSCSSMVKFLETKERTYACWNGILDSTKFYPYEEGIPKHLESVCVDKFFNKWYFHEEDDRAMRGKPCEALTSKDIFRAHPRPPKFQYDGYVQNIYCMMCGTPKDQMDHGKCGYHSQSSSHASSASSSAVPAKWTILCTKCMEPPGSCKCDETVLYKLGSMRYLEIPTIHWDQLIMTQVRGMTISTPDKRTVLLPRSEYKNTYRWITGFYFRPNYRIGPHAKAFEGDESNPERSPYADCWRVAFVIDGETNTGKSATIDMVKVYLPEFGNMSDTNTGQFMLQQCVANGKFKPILLGEMGPNALGRVLFCALVDATTVVPVPRKKIEDVNAVCDRGITILCNKFQLAGGDVEGSVCSRLAMVKYTTVVASNKVDGMIFNRNENDPIPLVRKGNMCYEDISANFGNSHFTEVCPTVFLEARNKFEEKANPLRQFLNQPYSEELGVPLVLDPDVWMKRKDLINAYKDHCKLNGIHRLPPWTDDHYDLRKAKIRVAPLGEIMDDDNNPIMEQCVYGIAPRTAASTIAILAAKQSQPVSIVGDDDDDEQESNSNSKLSTMTLMDQSINMASDLENALNALTMRSGVVEGFTKDMRDKMSIVHKHLDAIDESVEAEYVTGEVGNVNDMDDMNDM